MAIFLKLILRIENYFWRETQSLMFLFSSGCSVEGLYEDWVNSKGNFLFSQCEDGHGKYSSKERKSGKPLGR